MSSKLTNDLFRFMVVHPAATMDKEGDETLTTKYPFKREPSELFSKTKGAASTHSSVLENYIGSPLFIKNFADNNTYTALMRNVRTETKQHSSLTLTEFKDLVTRVTGKEITTIVSEHDYKGFVYRLWDSLYASSFCQDAAKHDKGPLIDMIRYARLFDDIASDKKLTARHIARILSSTVIIPTVSSKNQSAAGVTHDSVKTTKKAKSTFSGQANKIIQSIAELKHASQDLEESYNHQINRKNRAKVSSTKVEVDERRLKLSSRSLITKLGLSIDEDGYDYIQANLQDRVTKSYSLLSRTVGRDTTKRIKTSLESAAKSGFLEPSSGLGVINTSVGYDFGDANLTSFDNDIASSLGSVTPIGVGDLEITKEILMKYDEGEISHIENVMLTESKERVTEQTDTTSSTYSTTSSTESTKSEDLETTSRYQLSTETQKTISSQQSIAAGVAASATYGPVSVSANAQYNTSSATSSSTNTATSFAQDIVSKSVSSIVTSTSTTESVTTTSETKETNSHGFNNEGGTGHVVGIYRWVDKKYTCQVYNYGKRLMFEFIVPEPSSLYLQSLREAQAGGITAIEPDEITYNASNIKASNYMRKLAEYGAEGAEAPPAEFTYTGRAFSQADDNTDATDDSDDETAYVKEDNNLTVPDGYKVVGITVTRSFKTVPTEIAGRVDTEQFKVIVGGMLFDLTEDYTKTVTEEVEMTGTVPISVRSYSISNFVVNVELKCQRLDETFEEWQLSTYEKIVAAYNAQKADYDAALASAKSASEITIESKTSDDYRRIEQDELKRASITLLTNQHYAAFDAMMPSTDTATGMPEIVVDEAMKDGTYIKFFEQAFEWTNMTYTFYPYFWSNKSSDTPWTTKMNLTDTTDASFASFLRSGAAQVLVPVTPGSDYEEAVLYYLETGRVWDGGEAPVVEDDTYESLVAEMNEAEEIDVTDPIPVGDPWDVTIPTSLVILQEDATLPDWTEEGGYDGSES